jgi:hypothetical protein
MNAIKKALGLSTEPASDRFAKDDIAEVKKCEQKTRDACLRQLEFYFSDVNLPYDDFYLKARNKEGEIDCEVLANSARIKQFTKKLTPVQRAYLLWDVASGSDSVVRGSEGFLKRRWPMPKEDKSNKNMAFLELKVDEGGPSLDGVLDEASFKAALEKRGDAASFKPVLSVRPRRDLRKTRTLTGGVLVELESKAKADALLKAAADEPLLPKQTKVKVVTTSDGLSFFDRLEADCLAFREEGEKRKAKRKAEKEEKKKRKAEEAEKGEGDAKPSAKKAKKPGKKGKGGRGGRGGRGRGRGGGRGISPKKRKSGGDGDGEKKPAKKAKPAAKKEE